VRITTMRAGNIQRMDIRRSLLAGATVRRCWR
jgi:hypothetical protein